MIIYSFSYPVRSLFIMGNVNAKCNENISAIFDLRFLIFFLEVLPWLIYPQFPISLKLLNKNYRTLKKKTYLDLKLI